MGLRFLRKILSIFMRPQPGALVDLFLPLPREGRMAALRLRVLKALMTLPMPLSVAILATILALTLLMPELMAARWQQLEAMPEEIWWLCGTLVSLAFGAKLQARDHALLLDALTPKAGEGVNGASLGHDATLILAVEEPAENAALDEGTPP